jgi:hypothetical protein
MKLLNVIYGKMLMKKLGIKKDKKAQFKIQQMSFMLLAVVLFFILVSLFWLVIQYRNLHKQASQLEESKAVLTSEFLSDSTEFNCGSQSYCIDTDKLMVLSKRSVYEGFWPVSYVKVRKVYPEQGEEKVCNKATYPNCNLFNVYENKKIMHKSSVGSFVALCRDEKVGGYIFKKCELGKLIIGYELK